MDKDLIGVGKSEDARTLGVRNEESRWWAVEDLKIFIN